MSETFLLNVSLPVEITFLKYVTALRNGLMISQKPNNEENLVNLELTNYKMRDNTGKDEDTQEC